MHTSWLGRVGGLTELYHKSQADYAAYEHWANGEFEIVPARWRPGEAWGYIKGQWVPIDSTDVGMNARLLSRSAFRRRFGDLPALPAHAFITRRVS